MTAPAGQSSSKPIAIIAVHGVADQEPFESARQIAQMLLHHSAGKSDRPYEDFIETKFHIPETEHTFDLDLQQDDKKDRSYEFLKKQLTPEGEKGQKSSNAELNSNSKVLDTFASIRLEGDRKPQDQSVSKSQPIHIYCSLSGD